MYFKLIKKIWFIFFLIFLSFLQAFGQFSVKSRIYSEAPIYFDNGKKMSLQLTVKFNSKVIDLPIEKKEANILDLNTSYPNIINFFNNLSKCFGEIKFIKQIPDAKWGDVWRVSEITGDVIKIFDLSQLFTVRFQDFVPIDSIITELENMAEVSYAHQPIQVVSFEDPNDPAYIEGAGGSQWNLYKINASKAWDISKGSSEIVAGIIEPTFNLPNRNHPDLQGKFIQDKGDFGQPQEHSSMICGIIGALTDNGVGMASLGWNTMMIPYQFGSNSDYGAIVTKINQAVNDGVKIINFSWGTLESTPSQYKKCAYYLSKDYIEIYETISNAYYQHGVVFVAATGNTGLEQTNYDDDCFEILPMHFVPYPAAYEEVIGVSATDVNDEFGMNPAIGEYNHEELDYHFEPEFIDVAAPGLNIYSMNHASGYYIRNGTSFAAPHVAALTGLILSLDPELNPAQIRQFIINSADDIGLPGRDHYFGYGRINAHKALLLTLEYLAAENKSISSSATAHNSGRRLAWNSSSGYFHLVFASGGEIFYRRKPVWSSIWDNPIRLSDGGGNHDYPSITEKAGRVYVIWQQKTGSTTYKIHYAASMDQGVSWPKKYVLNTTYLSADPLPVIKASAAGDNSLMVVFRYGTGSP